MYIQTCMYIQPIFVQNTHNSHFMGIYGFVIRCPSGVWHRKLTTCAMHVGYIYIHITTSIHTNIAIVFIFTYCYLRTLGLFYHHISNSSVLPFSIDAVRTFSDEKSMCAILWARPGAPHYVQELACNIISKGRYMYATLWARASKQHFEQEQAHPVIGKSRHMRKSKHVTLSAKTSTPHCEQE